MELKTEDNKSITRFFEPENVFEREWVNYDKRVKCDR